MLAKSSYQGVLLGGKQYSEPLDCPPSIRSPTRRDTGKLLWERYKLPILYLLYSIVNYELYFSAEGVLEHKEAVLLYQAFDFFFAEN